MKRDHLADVIIPIIHLVNSGNSHADAIRVVAENQKYSNTSTCYERCTRHLGFDSIDQFWEKVHSDKIAEHLIHMFPERKYLIEKELRGLIFR